VTSRRRALCAITTAVAAALLLISAAPAGADSVTPITSFNDPRSDLPSRPGQLKRVLYGPYTIAPNSEIHNAANFSAPAPCTNCRITDMVPNLVYASDGTTANLETGAMLHHFVLFNPARPDVTCSNWPGERFLAAGNERSHVHLPTPFGYHNTSSTWRLIYHLVNKSSVPKTVNIEIVFRHRPVAETQPATPIWLDIDNCADSEYTAPEGYSDIHRDWTSTLEGRLLGLGGHLHDIDITNDQPCTVHCPEKGFGLGISAEIRGGPPSDYFGPQPPNNPPPADLTGATACRSEAYYGTTWAGTQWNGHLDTMSNCGVFTNKPAGAQSEAYPAGGAYPPGGYPLQRGQTIRLHSEYENNTGSPQTDVMGIMVGWVDVQSCDGVKPTKIGTEGNDNLTGTAGNDVIVGLGGNDTISGLGGNDKICGGSGNDILTGGDGSDTFTGGSGADTFNGGPKVDTVSYAERRTGVTVDVDGVADDGNSADGPAGARDRVQTDVENVIGGRGADTLTGNAGTSNTLDGREGADVLSGLGGLDTATYASRFSGVIADIDGAADDGSGLDGPPGARDRIKVDIENLIGGRGADTLAGSAGANRLTGGLGADRLRGLAGNDNLFANDGRADTEINCDGASPAGASDAAHVDGADPAPSGCESVGP